MSLAHGIRIGALGIALLAVAGWGAGGVGAMPDGADARVASTKAELPPFNFEIRTLSNRADLISDGDALVEVQVPKTVPMQQGDAHAQRRRRRRPLRRRRAATRTLRGVVTGLAPGENDLRRRTPTATATAGRGRASRITNHPRGGPVLLGSQTQPWICATPTPVAGLGQHAGVQRQRPVDLRGRRAVQHRDRVQAVLSHDDTPAARPRCPIPSPPRRAAGQQLLQALHARHHAGRPGARRRRRTA